MDSSWKKFWKRLRLVPAVVVPDEHKCRLVYIQTEPRDDHLEFRCSRCGLDWAWSRAHIQKMIDYGKAQETRRQEVVWRTKDIDNLAH